MLGLYLYTLIIGFDLKDTGISSLNVIHVKKGQSLGAKFESDSFGSVLHYFD